MAKQKIMISNNKDIPAEWIDIKDRNDFAEVLNLSYKGPVFIFKHSNRCGISFHAKHELEQWYQQGGRQLTVFFLDLLSYRHISNQIAEETGIPHQSPQLIAIVNGEAVNAKSHTSIEGNELNHFYNKIFPLAELTGGGG